MAGAGKPGKWESDSKGVKRVTLTDGTAAEGFAIVDADGNQITSFAGGPGGSGTEYTEGDTDASITGQAMLWEDTSDTLRAVSAAKPLPVSLASVPSHAVTNAGVFATQAAAAGDVAHDGVDSGNPMKMGGKAVAYGSNPTAVAAADRTDLYANRHGVQFTIGGHPNSKSCTYISTGAQTDDNVMAAISSGTKYAITRITITLDEATTVGTAVRLGFGTANVPALGSSGADAVDDILVYHPGLVPGGGLTIGDGSGVLGVGGDGAELRITCEAPTSGTIAVTVTYFTIES